MFYRALGRLHGPWRKQPLKLHNITLVETIVHVMLRSCVVLRWMCDKGELV